MSKQQKKRTSKNIKKQESTNPYKIVALAACLLLIILVVSMIAILIQKDNQNHDFGYYDRPTEQTKEDINKIPTSETDESIKDSANASEFITTDRAIDVALENIGATRQSVHDLDVELDYEFGQKVYEVTFDYNNYEYEYYINPISGEIIKSFKEIDY